MDRSSAVTRETSGSKSADRKESNINYPRTGIDLASEQMLLPLQSVQPLVREEEVASMLPSAPSSFAASASSDSMTQLDEIWEKDLNKVDLPEYVKANSTSITFPEKVSQRHHESSKSQGILAHTFILSQLMLMLIHIERISAMSGKRADEMPIGWTLQGRAFIIRSKDELVQTWLPKFFRHGKFQSFTRKLYPWGFRQVNLPRDTSQERRELVFANPHFQRDSRGLMVRMKSVTAAGLRRQQQQEQKWNESKLNDKEVEAPANGLLNFGQSRPGQPSIPESFLMNQANGLLRDVAPLALPNLSLAAFAGISQSPPAMLDPLSRQVLLNQLSREQGLSLADIIQQQQRQRITDQLRLPSSSTFGLSSSGSVPSLGSLTLPQNYLNQSAGVLSNPLQNLLDPSTPPETGIGILSRESSLQDRLRELAEQYLRNNRGPNAPP